MGEREDSSKEHFHHDEAKRVASGDSDAIYVVTDPYANLTLWQAIKKWRRVVVYCVCLTSAITM